MRRLRIYFYWRDLWVGMYVAEDAIYVCPLPTLVIRWQRIRCTCGFDGSYRVIAPGWGEDWPEHGIGCPLAPVSAAPQGTLNAIKARTLM